MAYVQHKFRRSLDTVSATHSFEIEVGLTGTYLPGYAATHMEPGCDDAMEDIDIENIGGLTLVRPPVAERGSHNRIWKTVDLLEGVDRKSEAYKRIVQNLLAFIGDDAVSALMAEVSE